jgi:lipoprotein-releasing system permease protein
MFKPYPAFIGFRYAGTKRNNQLVSFISRVSMLGMAVGVALLILVLSVMNGFDREMRTKILGLVPQINVLSYGQSAEPNEWQEIQNSVLEHPEVKAIAPFVQLNAMLLRGTDVEGVLVYGIDPVREKNVSIINNYVSTEALDSLSDKQDALGSSILLGAALADRLHIKKGQSINLMVPQEGVGGRISPRFVRLKVAGVFATGTELDQSVALISLNRALSLFPVDQRKQGLRVTLYDTFAAPRVAWELNQSLPYGYTTRDWTRTHGNLYSAIQLSKQLVGLMLLTIIAVAAFNVVSALVMIVTDKRGDIAILRTAGASPMGIMAVFMLQGTLIALMGTLAGTVVGVLLSLSITEVVASLEALLHIQFLNSDVYPIDYLPADLRLEDVLLVCGSAFIISVISTIYPAWRAARVLPAEALRYDS